MENIKPKDIPFSQKSVLIQHIQQYISRNICFHNNSKSKVYDIKRLDYSGTYSPAQSYLLELIVTKADGSNESKKIKLKRVNQKFPIQVYTKLQSRDFSMIHSIQIPKIFHVDDVAGYILTEFLSGKDVSHLLREIIDQGYIKNQQKKAFEKIGQGLADIHTKLNIIHGDPRLVNWIYRLEDDRLSLIDWEWAGGGDPAWDLSRLIYDLGRRVSRLKFHLSSIRTNEIYDIFDALCLAIIDGYADSEKNRDIIRKSASFWIHHSLSVTVGIHEIIFKNCSYPPPKEIMFLRRIPEAIFLNIIKKDQNIIKNIFRIFTQLTSLFLLVTNERERKDIFRAFKRLTQMFAREIKHMV